MLAYPIATACVLIDNSLPGDDVRVERRPMALVPLNVPALPPATLAALLAGGAATAMVLVCALRKARSHDWVVALGWGAGGALAAGTGLWTLQLALWHAVQDPAAPWFVARIFIGAWGLAVAGCAALMLLARWLPWQGGVNAAALVLLLPLLAMAERFAALDEHFRSTSNANVAQRGCS